MVRLPTGAAAGAVLHRLPLAQGGQFVEVRVADHGLRTRASRGPRSRSRRSRWRLVVVGAKSVDARDDAAAQAAPVGAVAGAGGARRPRHRRRGRTASPRRRSGGGKSMGTATVAAAPLLVWLGKRVAREDRAADRARWDRRLCNPRAHARSRAHGVSTGDSTSSVAS